MAGARKLSRTTRDIHESLTISSRAMVAMSVSPLERRAHHLRARTRSWTRPGSAVASTAGLPSAWTSRNARPLRLSCTLDFSTMRQGSSAAYPSRACSAGPLSTISITLAVTTICSTSSFPRRRSLDETCSASSPHVRLIDGSLAASIGRSASTSRVIGSRSASATRFVTAPSSSRAGIRMPVSLGSSPACCSDRLT